MGNASLGALRHKVEDGCSRCFGAGSCCCRHCDQGLERLVDGKTFSQWCIDEVEKVSFWIADIEIHEFSSVDYRAATDCEESIWLIWLRERDGFFDSVRNLSESSPLTKHKRTIVVEGKQRTSYPSAQPYTH